MALGRRRKEPPEDSCRRCSMCGISYPDNMVRYGKCLVCGDPTDRVRDLPDDDWELSVELLKTNPPPAESKGDAVLAHRVSRLVKCGLPYDAAVYTAKARAPEGGYTVDLHKFEEMVARGCEPILAAQILR